MWANGSFYWSNVLEIRFAPVNHRMPKASRDYSLGASSRFGSSTCSDAPFASPREAQGGKAEDPRTDPKRRVAKPIAKIDRSTDPGRVNCEDESSLRLRTFSYLV